MGLPPIESILKTHGEHLPELSPQGTGVLKYLYADSRQLSGRYWGSGTNLLALQADALVINWAPMF